MEPQIARNAPCWCGSGVRYKHCHGLGVGAAPGSSTGGQRPALPAASTREEALAAHRKGALGRAEELYRSALVTNPADVDVLHMLGVVQLQRLRHRDALDLLFDAAERTAWNVPAIRHNLALAVGKLTAREANARQAELVELSLALDRGRESIRDDISPSVSVVLWVDAGASGDDDLAPRVEVSLGSVFAQDYRDLELVVAAGRAAGTVRDALARRTAHPRCSVEVLADAGGSAANMLNRAIRVARGTFVALLRAGDDEAPDRISALVDAVPRRRGRWGFSLVAQSPQGPTARESSRDGHSRGAPVSEPPSPAEYATRLVDVTTRQRIALGTPPVGLALVETNVTMVPANLFVERALFDELGGFREFAHHWDWDFCLRAVQRAEPVVVQRPLYLAAARARHATLPGNVIASLGGADSSTQGADEVDAAAQVVGGFLRDALASPDAANPLAPQHPANRYALLKQVFRANLGALIPAQDLRAIALELRTRATGNAVIGAASVTTGTVRRSAVVVLGMHRSGTSAVARVLNLCGATLPLHVKPARLGVNAKGFWEPEAVLDLDSRLMQQLGGEWDRVDFALPESGSVVDEFLSDAVSVVADEYGGAPTILIKDPRIGVLAPLWERALHGAGYRSAWVVPIRNPLDVARSLHARGDMGVREGLALWLAYARRIDDFTRGRSDAIFVTYEELLAGWRAVVARIAHRLDVALDVDAAAAEVDRFLDRDMRHHAAGEAELAALPSDPLIDEVRAVYGECLRRCADDRGAANPTSASATNVSATSTSQTPDAAFVLCIENNGIREQALLLCESLRRNGGRHRHARIVAFAPRPGLGVDRETRARLADLAVDYVDEPLNLRCPAYAPANRVFAGAFAEAELDSEWIAVLDSDTLVLDEIEFPVDDDAVVRPVDEKGSATRGPGDPFEPYWLKMAERAGVELERLPRLRTTISGELIRASYNAGFALVRRRTGILDRCAKLFAASLDAGWRPYAGSGIEIHASTGDVGREGSEFWGSSQTALALAVWAATQRVQVATDRYNVPLHLIAAAGDIEPRWLMGPPAHVHYHWMFGARNCEIALELLARLGVPAETLGWIGGRLPLAGG